MTKEELYDYIEQDREIEFCYKDKDYSITYGEDEGGEYISFCEFYK